MPSSDPTLYPFTPQLDAANTIPNRYPYANMGMNPIQSGISLGILGAMTGMGISGVQRTVAKMRGLDNDDARKTSVWQPMMIGGLIGTALGTIGGLNARRAQTHDNSGLSWSEIANKWPTYPFTKANAHDSGKAEFTKAALDNFKQRLMQVKRAKTRAQAELRERPESTIVHKIQQAWRNHGDVIKNRAALQRLELNPEYIHAKALADPAKLKGTGMPGVSVPFYNLAVNPGHRPGQAPIGLGSLGGSGKRDQFLGSLYATLAAAGGGTFPTLASAAYSAWQTGASLGTAKGYTNKSTGKVIPGHELDRRRALNAAKMHGALAGLDAVTLGRATPGVALFDKIPKATARAMLTGNIAADAATMLYDPRFVSPDKQPHAVPTAADMQQLIDSTRYYIERNNNNLGPTRQKAQSLPQGAGIAKGLLNKIQTGVKSPVSTVSDLGTRIMKGLRTQK